MSICGLAQAQTNGSPIRPITLQECFDLALSNNLTLKIERINPLLAEENLNIARGYYDPSFTFSGTHSHNESSRFISNTNGAVIPLRSRQDGDTFSSGLGGNGPFGLSYGLAGDASATDTKSGFAESATSSGSAGLKVTQPLLRNFLYDNGRFNIDVSKNQIKQSEQQLRLQIMTVLNQVEQAYYNLSFAWDYIKVQQMALELTQRLLEENRKKVQIGVLAPLDEKQAESQVAARQTLVTAAYRNLSVAQNALKTLVTGQYRHVHAERLQPSAALLAVPVQVDLMESWTRAMTLRPDLIQARLDLERQGITLKYYKNQMLPELVIEGSYGYNGAGSEFAGTFNDISRTDKPFWTAGAAVNIPLPNRVARGNYRQSKLNVDKALLSLKSREEAALIQVDEDVSQLKASWAQVASTRAARTYAEQALDAEQKKLVAGKSTSFFVLSLQNDLTSARSAEIRALADYNIAQAQLSFDEGTTLKRNNVNVNLK